MWTTRSPATGVLLLSPVPFPLQNPAEAACPCSFISRCGFAVHMGQQQTFACSPAQDLHIYTGLAAQTAGWSQCHKHSLQKTTLNPCLAEHVSNPLPHRWVPNYHPSLLGSIPRGFHSSPHPAHHILPVFPSPPAPPLHTSPAQGAPEQQACLRNTERGESSASHL